MNPKQKEIYKYLSTVESASIDEIYRNVSFSYYCNQNKHLGAILSTMVRNGTVVRIKKGLFSSVNTESYKDQTKLF